MDSKKNNLRWKLTGDGLLGLTNSEGREESRMVYRKSRVCVVLTESSSSPRMGAALEHSKWHSINIPSVSSMRISVPRVTAHSIILLVECADVGQWH